jgi:DNA-binding transcriptional regulator PaaX
MGGVRKYKYYLTKPKSAIVADVFTWLLVGGVVAIASTSPYFVPNLLRVHKSLQKYPKNKVSDTFYRLKKQGFIKIEESNRQMYISLTSEGKKRAGVFQIDKLRIQKPKRWDKKWRLLLFDIPEKRKISREALRGKLKELGFAQFQKSVWVHPYNCKTEIELLQDFFGLSRNEIRLIVAESIDGDRELREYFKLSF